MDGSIEVGSDGHCREQKGDCASFRPPPSYIDRFCYMYLWREGIRDSAGEGLAPTWNPSIQCWFGGNLISSSNLLVSGTCGELKISARWRRGSGGW